MPDGRRRQSSWRARSPPQNLWCCVLVSPAYWGCTHNGQEKRHSVHQPLLSPAVMRMSQAGARAYAHLERIATPLPPAHSRGWSSSTACMARSELTPRIKPQMSPAVPHPATTQAPPEERFQVVRQLSAAIHGAGVHGDKHAAGGQEADAASLKVEPCQVRLQRGNRFSQRSATCAHNARGGLQSSRKPWRSP